MLEHIAVVESESAAFAEAIADRIPTIAAEATQ